MAIYSLSFVAGATAPHRALVRSMLHDGLYEEEKGYQGATRYWRVVNGVRTELSYEQAAREVTGGASYSQSVAHDALLAKAADVVAKAVPQSVAKAAVAAAFPDPREVAAQAPRISTPANPIVETLHPITPAEAIGAFLCGIVGKPEGAAEWRTETVWCRAGRAFTPELDNRGARIIPRDAYQGVALVAHNPTHVERCLRAFGLDNTVSTEPVRVQRGQGEPCPTETVPDYRAFTVQHAGASPTGKPHTQAGDVLSIQGTIARPVQNRDAFAALNPLVDSDDVNNLRAYASDSGARVALQFDLPQVTDETLRVGGLGLNSFDGSSVITFRASVELFAAPGVYFYAPRAFKTKHTADYASRLAQAPAVLTAVTAGARTLATAVRNAREVDAETAAVVVARAIGATEETLLDMIEKLHEGAEKLTGALGGLRYAVAAVRIGGRALGIESMTWGIGAERAQRALLALAEVGAERRANMSSAPVAPEGLPKLEGAEHLTPAQCERAVAAQTRAFLTLVALRARMGDMRLDDRWVVALRTLGADIATVTDAREWLGLQPNGTVTGPATFKRLMLSRLKLLGWEPRKGLPPEGEQAGEQGAEGGAA